MHDHTTTNGRRCPTRFRSDVLLAGALAAGLTFITACSGGGGSGPTPPDGGGGGGADRSLLVDGDLGGRQTLAGRLAVLALERPDGSFTGNLVAPGTPVSLLSADSVERGIVLEGAPDGDYVALRLRWLDDDLEHVGDDGHRRRVRGRSELRVPFDGTVARIGSGDRWLQLRHRRAPRLDDGPQGPAVDLDLAVRRGDQCPIDRSRLEVIAADRGGRVLRGVLRDLGDLVVDVRLGDATRLYGLDGRRDAAAFWSAVQPGHWVRLRGLLHRDGRVDAEWIELRGDDRGGRRDRAELHGHIASLDHARQELILVVARLEHGAWDGERRARVTVDLRGAKIHRSGHRDELLDIGRLAVSQRVEVEARTRTVGDRIHAHEVEIEHERGGHGPEIEGAVGAVDLQARTIRAVPRGDDPLIVGGRRVAEATVRVADTTRIVDKDSSATLALRDLRPGARLWIFGSIATDGSIAATWIRVRDRR